MRTTIFLEDLLGARLQEAARRRGQTLSAFLAEAGRRQLDEKPAPRRKFKLVTFDGGGVLPGVNLDRTSDLLVAEDRETYGPKR